MPAQYASLAEYVRQELWQVCTGARPAKFNFLDASDVSEFFEEVQTVIEDLDLQNKAHDCMMAMRAAPV